MSRPLSVALLSHLSSARAPTGAEHSLALLARGLDERGHTVRVALQGPWALESPLAEAGIECRHLPCRVCWLAYHDPLPAWRAVAKWARFALPDRGCTRLGSWILESGADVVHVNCLPHLRGAAVAWGAGLPVVWHLREILPPGRRRRWFAGKLARYATRIVAVSAAVAAWLEEEGLGARTTVVHNGVESRGSLPDPSAARQELGIPSGGCLVGLFGQLVPHKGAEAFFAAAESALSQEPRLRFVLAGSGRTDYVAALEERARVRGGGRIHVLPPQPTADTLLAAADVVCLATTTPDPLPRSVLEAMAAGRPVAAFRSGGTAEMVEHERTGLLVEVGDAPGLASAFVNLGRDPVLRQRLGAAARSRAAAEFSVAAHVDRMERVLYEAHGARAT